MKKKRMVKPRSSSMVPRVISRRFPQITRVIDATDAMVLDLTQADIDDAKRGDFEECAFARAACRMHGALRALVSKRVFYVLLPDGITAVRYAVPERARAMLTSFDRGGGMALGEYVFQPPRPSTRLGVRHYHRPSRIDPRPRHDASGQHWVAATPNQPGRRMEGVRDLNMADVIDVKPVRRLLPAKARAKAKAAKRRRARAAA